MITEIIWTPNEHKGKDLWNSPLWEGCYADSEMNDEINQSKKQWFVYHIKFDNLKPIQIVKSNLKINNHGKVQ